MGEIKDFINLYIEDSGMIDEVLDDVSLNLTANIQDQLYPGHGYFTGNLHDSIQSNIASKSKLNATIEAYTMVEYAKWVNDGSPAVKGKLMKMPWGYRRSRKASKGIKFMEKGLDATVAMYR
jgi:hypothetical protein